jgi:hypothetical protein
MSHPESTATRGTSMRAPQVPGPAAIAGLVKGGFRYTLTDGRWWWSSGMYMLLGIDTKQLCDYPPSTRLLLAHLLPADRRSVAQAWTHLRTGRGPVAFGTRIVGLDAVVRPVFVTASADGHRTVSAVSGVIQLER